MSGFIQRSRAARGALITDAVQIANSAVGVSTTEIATHPLNVILQLCLRATYGADSNPRYQVGSAMTLTSLRAFEVTRGAASAGERLHRTVIDVAMLNRSGA